MKSFSRYIPNKTRDNCKCDPISRNVEKKTAAFGMRDDVVACVFFEPRGPLLYFYINMYAKPVLCRILFPDLVY